MLQKKQQVKNPQDQVNEEETGNRTKKRIQRKDNTDDPRCQKKKLQAQIKKIQKKCLTRTQKN